MSRLTQLGPLLVNVLGAWHFRPGSELRGAVLSSFQELVSWGGLWFLRFDPGARSGVGVRPERECSLVRGLLPPPCLSQGLSHGPPSV